MTNNIQDLTIYAEDYADTFWDLLPRGEVKFDESTNQITITDGSKRVVVKFDKHIVIVYVIEVKADTVVSDVVKCYYDEDSDLLDLYYDVEKLI